MHPQGSFTINQTEFLPYLNTRMALYYPKNKTCMCAKSLQSCLTLCAPMDLPGSSLHGILQSRIVEWVAIFSSKGSSQTRD